MSVPAEGLVVGKFLPPHRGHHLLIEEAAARCLHLTVVVSARTDEPIPAELRTRWVERRHPSVTVQGFVDDHPVDFDDAEAWQHWADAFLAQWRLAEPGRERSRPDVLYSSEPYGEELAARIGCRHEAVDPARDAEPISGTAVRDDPFGSWAFLDPEVRAYFVKRVVVIGAESTGKTTLCERLARHYGTVWVPEHGRAYTQEKAAAHGGRPVEWASPEFVSIARTQLEDEDRLAEQAAKVLVCDTDPLATVIWHERYVGGDPPGALLALAAGARYDLYLLSSPEGVPWVADGLRDGEHERAWMHERFLDELTSRGLRFTVLTGTWEQREAAAIAAIDEVLASPWHGQGYRPHEPGDRSRRFGRAVDLVPVRRADWAWLVADGLDPRKIGEQYHWAEAPLQLVIAPARALLSTRWPAAIVKVDGERAGYIGVNPLSGNLEYFLRPWARGGAGGPMIEAFLGGFRRSDRRRAFFVSAKNERSLRALRNAMARLGWEEGEDFDLQSTRVGTKVWVRAEPAPPRR